LSAKKSPSDHDHPGTGEPVCPGDGDHQWIHVDVERPRPAPGGPIAHGFLTLLIPNFSRLDQIRNADGRELRLNKVRFTSPVPVAAGRAAA
jgi:acyl dehydratase